jgi:predicted nucleic acid-binding protein
VTLVVDASMVVAALVDSGPDGSWADSLLAGEPLAAPHLLPAEVANILRRAASAEEISNDTAALAHADLLALPIEFFPYELFAERVWQLRDNLTTYDAWYVALAEELAARLATLDRPLSRVSGPRCDFETPPQPSGRA